MLFFFIYRFGIKGLLVDAKFVVKVALFLMPKHTSPVQSVYSKVTWNLNYAIFVCYFVNKCCSVTIQIFQCLSNICITMYLILSEYLPFTCEI